MIRHKPEFSSQQDHSAWRESMSEEEKLIGNTPTGYWYDLVNISQVKRLLQYDMPQDLRLRFLEVMNKHVKGLLTVEAMQRVEPACDATMKMLEEMKSLHIGDKCRLMQRWNVMAAFCNLNPSIVEAMRLFQFFASMPIRPAETAGLPVTL